MSLKKKVKELCNELKDGDTYLSPGLIASVDNSPFAVQCEMHMTAEEKKKLKNKITPFIKMLFEDGRSWENRVMNELYPDASVGGGFENTIQCMIDGDAIISQASLTHAPTMMKGRPDILIRRDTHGSTIGGISLDYHYIVGEIKSAKNIKRGHILQSAFGTILLGHIQDYRPNEFFIINGEMNTTWYELVSSDKRKKNWENEVNTCVELIENIRKNPDMIEPVYGYGGDWSDYGDGLAIKNNDISIIPGVTEKIRDKIISNLGVRTVADICDGDISPETLSDTCNISLEKALQIFFRAQSINTGEIIVFDRDKLYIPDTKYNIFIDIEGNIYSLEESKDEMKRVMKDYLIGVHVSSEKSKVIQEFFTAKNLDDECNMIKKFIEYMESIINKDITIYHWGHYEKTHLKNLFERHNMNMSLFEKMSEKMIDLYTTVTKSTAFPIYDYGVKSVATAISFSWPEDILGQDTIKLYRDYIDKKEGSEDNLKIIKKYNEYDCLVLKEILRRLQELTDKHL